MTGDLRGIGGRDESIDVGDRIGVAIDGMADDRRRDVACGRRAPENTRSSRTGRRPGRPPWPTAVPPANARSGDHVDLDRLRLAGPRPARRRPTGPRRPGPGRLQFRADLRPDRVPADRRAQPGAARPAPRAAVNPRRRPPGHLDPPLPRRRAGPARGVPPSRGTDGPAGMGRSSAWSRSRRTPSAGCSSSSRSGRSSWSTIPRHSISRPATIW